jgi:serine-type D-Ala-D-Ala carboxypeptidase/endopeptidase (penicillin-binding protein 4)
MALSTAGCAGRGGVQTPPPPAAERLLPRTLTSIFDEAATEALWTALVVRDDTGEVLFERAADQPVLPASNMKIVTLAAAVQRLGWDHRFTTVIRTTAPAAGGVVAGDLCVHGSGDPSIGWPTDTAADTMRAWARELRARGVTRIEGDLVGDPDAHGTGRLGDSWTWDDLPFGYAAPYAGLIFHENVVRVRVTPAARAGEHARVEMAPAGSGLELTGLVQTGDADTAPRVVMDRAIGSGRLTVQGTVPVGGAPVVRQAAVQDAPRFFLEAFRLALAVEGIDVRGDVRVDALPDRPADEGIRIEHRSEPLRALAVRFMKVSQNLYGEALLHALVVERSATLADRRAAVTAALEAWGVASDRLQVADGSGLSRRNFLTPRALVGLLRALDTPPHAQPFRAALPIAGVDGTLEHRFVDSACTGRLQAKTGTLSHARALSGYLTTASGRPVTFSVIANNYLAATSTVDATVEQALIALCAS